MLTLLPRTLRGRTVLLTGATIVLSHLLGLIVYMAANAADLSAAREQYIADQLVTITRLCEQLPADERASTAALLSDFSMQLSVSDTPLIIENDAMETDVEGLRRLLGLAIGPTFNQGVLADYRDVVGDDIDYVRLTDLPQRPIATQRVSRLFRFHSDVLVSIRLNDGQWLNAMVPGPPLAGLSIAGIIPSMLLMTLLAIGLTNWIIGRPLGAIARFAATSEAMARDLSRTDLPPEQGAPELRRAARAFNTVHRRARTLLEDRDRMIAGLANALGPPLSRLRLRMQYLGSDQERALMARDLDDMECMLESVSRLEHSALLEQKRFQVDLGAMLADLAREHALPPPELVLHGVPAIHYHCAPEAMRQALAELVDNAVTYGSDVRIRMQLRPDELLICVDDQGPGLATAEQEQVFQPFQRLEPAPARNRRGLGLGLPRARAIIDAHGGELTLTHPGADRGLRARVSLPLTGLADSGRD